MNDQQSEWSSDPEDSLKKKDSSLEQKRKADDNQSEVDYEHQNILYYRTMGWKKTTVMLLLEYVCLAILNMPWIFDILGCVLGLCFLILFALIAYYVGILVLKVSLTYPHIRDYCDFARVVCGQHRFFYEFAFVCLILNNIFVQGMHILMITIVLNTITEHALCTIAFSAIATVVSIIASIPRTFGGLTILAILSALAMVASIVSTIGFASVMKEPAGYNGISVVLRYGPKPGRSFTQIFSALLNIIFTFMGHICYPSFIYEMKKPVEFKKALKVLCISQIVLYCSAAMIMYHYFGQYSTAPIQSALPHGAGKKISYSFAAVPSLLIGVLYALVAVKNIFFRIYGTTKHHYKNTAYGWSIWICLLSTTWLIGFLISILVPFFSALVSVISALFNPFFGFIFPGIGYLKVAKHKREEEEKNTLEEDKPYISRYKAEIVCGLLCIIGTVLFFVGIYSAADEIKSAYQSKQIRSPFSCADNSI